MSGVGAIAEVTTKLCERLALAFGPDLAAIGVTSLSKLRPPDEEMANPKLNLLLYQILPNAARSNDDLPGRPGVRPLALELRYLLTAVESDQLAAQRALGAAMFVLHEHPMLTPDRPEAPFERARVTLRPLQLDEVERLWSGTPTPWRLSVAYDVSVVLIEPLETHVQPLPVLVRNITVVAGKAPRIDAVEIGDRALDRWLRSLGRAGRRVAEVDDIVTLRGGGLAAMRAALLTSINFPDRSVELATEPLAGGHGVQVQLAKALLTDARIPAGPCSIYLLPEAAEDRPTEAVFLMFAPKVEVSWAPEAPPPPGTEVSFEVSPSMVEGQQVELLVGQQEVQWTQPAPGVIRFTVREGASSDAVRLRVDGVESLLLDPDVIPDEKQGTSFWPRVKEEE